MAALVRRFANAIAAMDARGCRSAIGFDRDLSIAGFQLFTG